MSVVSNSSPLIALAQIQRLDLVPAILQSVLIPPAVARAIALSIPVLPQWATVQAPTSRPSVLTSPGRLGDGERDAIALAMEVGAAAIVLDDRPARRAAEAAGLNVIGTLGLLLEAKRKGLVTRVRPELEKLVATSFFLSRPLYERLLEMAGESEEIGASDRPTEAFDIRQAEPSDVDAIALAHRDSIQSIGPAYYPAEIVAYWQGAIEGYVFGSAAHGAAGPLSDVDVAVLTRGSPADDDLVVDRVADRLERTLRVPRVDVVALSRAALPLRYRVIRDGTLDRVAGRRTAGAVHRRIDAALPRFRTAAGSRLPCTTSCDSRAWSLTPKSFAIARVEFANIRMTCERSHRFPRWSFSTTASANMRCFMRCSWR